MARRLDRDDACTILNRVGISRGKNFFTLPSSAVSALVDEARRVGYRKSKNAPGSRGRMFYQYLQRLCR